MSLGNSYEYAQVQVQYRYIVMSPDSYVPFTESQANLCKHMGIVYCCKSAHLLRHRSVPTCASSINYQMDLVTKARHCKAKYNIYPRQDPALLHTGNMILLLNISKP